jgi:head-tail adaptor
MIARKYTKAIAIWRTAPVADGFGGFTTSETLLYSVWANVATKKVFIKNENGQSDNINQVVFTFRNRYDIIANQKTDCIKYGGLVYNIDSIQNIDLDNIDIQIYGSQRN